METLNENTTKYTEVQSYGPKGVKLYEVKVGNPNSSRVVLHFTPKEAQELALQLLANLKLDQGYVYTAK